MKTLRIWARVGRRLIVNPIVRTVIRLARALYALATKIWQGIDGLYGFRWANNLLVRGEEDGVVVFVAIFSIIAWILGFVLLYFPTQVMSMTELWLTVILLVGPAIMLCRGVYWVVSRLIVLTRKRIRTELQRAKEEIGLE